MKLLMLLIPLLASSYLLAEYKIDPTTGFYVDTDYKKNQLKKQSKRKKGSEEIRVFWWNIFNGALYSTENGINLITKNITKLAQSKMSPDIIMLGEYIKNENHNVLDTNLKKLYPYKEFVQYNPYAYRFIAIYSKLPIKDIETKEIKWFSSFKQVDRWINRCEYIEGTSERHPIAKSCLRFFRKIIKLSFSHKDRSFALYPVHLLQPWDYLKNHFDQSYPSTVSSAMVAYEIATGESNPLMVQTSNFISQFWQLHKPQESPLIIGDFNIPKYLTPLKVKTHGYKLLEKQFLPVFTKGVSFPSQYGRTIKAHHQSMPDMLIDHAWTLLNNKSMITNSYILPFSGSDHYPIMVDILPNKKIPFPNLQYSKSE